jgi:hypothetical protein
MDALIDIIRSAVASGASTDQKAAGVQACRTIAAALDTEPGKTFVLPSAPQPSPLSRLSIDQVLELAIAKLSSVATERDAAPAPQPIPSRLQIPMAVTPPRIARMARATKPSPHKLTRKP